MARQKRTGAEEQIIGNLSTTKFRRLIREEAPGNVSFEPRAISEIQQQVNKSTGRLLGMALRLAKNAGRKNITKEDLVLSLDILNQQPNICRPRNFTTAPQKPVAMFEPTRRRIHKKSNRVDPEVVDYIINYQSQLSQTLIENAGHTTLEANRKRVTQRDVYTAISQCD